MRIILTGSSGRIGRAIYNALSSRHQVIGIDRSPFSTTHIVSDFADLDLLVKYMREADAVIHTAALHAPHVGIATDADFHRINVDGTRLIIEAAIKTDLPRLVFTSTTAVFGQTITDGKAAWVADATIPAPRTIYHTTKLEAEALLQAAASERLHIRVIRMSRCFPERADVMALHRLTRGIDARDVATAHAAALINKGPCYQSYIISGKTPFRPEDCPLLATDLTKVLEKRAPEFLAEFNRRGWYLPSSIDRVYDSSQAESGLGWTPHHGFEEVLAQLDRGSLEVLSFYQPGQDV